MHGDMVHTTRQAECLGFQLDEGGRAGLEAGPVTWWSNFWEELQSEN